MMTLNTAFKRIFGEALAPYGFIKIKGNRPYFVRLIGNEILQVISYKTEWEINPYKAFDILGGIATVYRGALTLDDTPRNNDDWLDSVGFIYGRLHWYDYDKEFASSFHKFKYIAGDEESMIREMRRAWDITKQIMIPELDKVTDLKSCMKYFRIYSGTLQHIFSDDIFGQIRGNRYNEGLLNLKLYSVDEYTKCKKEHYEIREKYFDYEIDNAQSEATKEAFKKTKENAQSAMLKQIELFKRMVKDSELYSRAMRELERRRVANTEKLRSYGFEV
ncbi:MAG: hypothetical protein ACI39Q_05600 [Wujia sp.]